MKTLIPLAVFIMFTTAAIGGTIKLTTSDNAPTYNSGKEVVIPSSATVQIETKCDNGTVSVSFGTLPTGVTDSPTGQNSTDEVDTFSFSGSAIGSANQLTANITHNATDPGGNPCLPSGEQVTFTACVPKIVVTRPPGDTTTNNYDALLFHTQPIITGCDDFTQIEWVQQITNLSKRTNYDGSVSTVTNYGSGTIDDPSLPSGWASPGSSLWAFTISGSMATLVGDNHSWGDPSLDVTLGTHPTIYEYCRYLSEACTFQDKIRRKADQAPLGEYDWSFTWDNLNDTWPNPPGLASFQAATHDATSAYGGTAVGGTPSGEFSNVSGITLP